MDDVEFLLVGLLVAVAGMGTLARVLGVPYPILLVIGGLGLGLVPGAPQVELEPDLVLVIFLPPLLYAAAFFSSLRDLRADLRSISTLSIGLVLATTCAVAVVAHALIDGLPWAAAFALGAVVSPTDPVAATAIMGRLGAPRRIATVVEGESLVNDATALVAYRVAIGAATGGSFSLMDAGLEFVVSAAGGVAVGLAVGWLIARLRRRLQDPPVEITISLLTAYAAYLPAEQLHLSGVLAAVSSGIYLGWQAPRIASATTRLQSFPVWEILQFLLNATLFLLVGLQLGVILEELDSSQLWTYVGYGAAVSLVVVVTRIVWVFASTAFIRAVDRRPSQLERRSPGADRFVVAWSGMRGAVSLAAALAIPLETDAGAPFPGRDAIVFVTFFVIFVTLVVQGLSLPPLLHALGIRDDGEEEREELAARRRVAEAALERLDALDEQDWTREDSVRRMRGLFEYRRRRFAARTGDEDDDGYEDRSQVYQRMVHDVIGAQRAELLRLRDAGEISSDAMHRIERDLDLEEERLEQ